MFTVLKPILKYGLIGYVGIGLVNSFYSLKVQKDSVTEFKNYMLRDRNITTNPFFIGLTDHLAENENMFSLDSIMLAGVRGIGWIFSLGTVCKNISASREGKRVHKPGSPYTFSDFKNFLSVMRLDMYRSHIFLSHDLLSDMYDGYMKYRLIEAVKTSN